MDQFIVHPHDGIYEFAWLGDMSVNQVRGTGPFERTVSGEFGSSSFSFFALNLKWTY